MWGKRTGRLGEKTAWRLALRWKKELRGYVKLAYQSDSLKGIIPSYDWVDFDLTLHDDTDPKWHRKMQRRWWAAQVASVIWTLISRCSGFSGEENPIFWKRVFSEYEHRDDASITDEIRFFTSDPFPRFRLCASLDFAIDSFAETFRGLLDYQGRSITSAVTSLKPFLLARRLDEPVRVSISYRSRSRTPRSLRAVEVIKAMSAMRELQWTGTIVKPDIAQWIPSFALTNADTPPVMLRDFGEPWMMMTFVQMTSLRFSRLEIDATNLCRNELQTFLEGLVAGNSPYKSACRADEVSLQLLSIENFAATCSILPLVKTQITLSLLPGIPSPTSVGPNHPWYWLDYANFHPNAARTSLKKLRFGHIVSSAESIEVIRQLGASEHRLHQVRVKLRTRSVIHENPTFESPSVRTLYSDTVLDVYPWAMDENPSMAWIAVVVPTYGFGWVRREAVIEQELKPVGLSKLRALSWTGWSADVTRRNERVRELLVSFLKHFGQQLRLLRADVVDAATPRHFYEILDVTPKLTSLEYRGIVIDAIKMQPVKRSGAYPLRECVLNLSYDAPYHAIMDGPLTNVTAINIGRYGRHVAGLDHGQDAYEARLELCSQLLDRNSQLQYLVTFRQYSKIMSRMNYADAREMARKTFGIPRKRSEIVLVPLRADCKLVFLGVLRRLGHLGAVSDQWEVDTLRKIFDFASSDAHREVCVAIAPYHIWMATLTRRQGFWERIFFTIKQITTSSKITQIWLIGQQDDFW